MYCSKFNINRNYKVSSSKILVLLILICVSNHTNAQQDSLTKKNYSIEFQLFGNANFNDKKSNTLTFDYNIKRTLIIYKQKISKNYNFCLAGDTYVKDGNEIYNRTPYLKRAYLQYHNQNLSITAGLLVSEQFKFQRNIWQLRYVDKTFQNKFDYGENRNIGILLKHKINSRFSYDVAFSSGYFTPMEYSSEKYQIKLGQTLKTDFCSVRLFNSISLNPNYEQIVSLFITKEVKKNKLGIEVAKKISNNKLLDDDQYGFSVFGNHSFNKNIMCFVRYDLNKKYIESQTENVIWAGTQYSFMNHINFSIFYKNIDFENNFYDLAIFIH